jgi:hypothetical protein
MSRRRIVGLAWLNVSLHVAGLALAAAFMRPGSPLAPLSDRLAYLAAQPSGWTIAWCVWAACALAMASFAFAIAVELRTAPARWAVVAAAVAAVADLTCDARYAFSFPKLAFQADSAAHSFLAQERWTNFVSLAIANGLYSISTLLSTFALRGRVGLAPGTTPAGVGVFACGMVLAAAGIVGSPDLAFWATPPTIGLYCVWVLLVARSLTHAGSGP